jgi:hypothetical protein
VPALTRGDHPIAVAANDMAGNVGRASVTLRVR